MNFNSRIDPSISCTNCGGTVNLNSNLCGYCGTRYDIDLARIKYGTEETKLDRSCPDCHSELSTIDLKLGGRFLIERCQDCHGVFLDPLELEEFLERIYKHQGPVNTMVLPEFSNNINKSSRAVRYRKCPVCTKLMARRNFGHRSGVIMDTCRDHGTWLDSGELNQLVRWSKAGGQNIKCNLNTLSKKRERQKQSDKEDRLMKILMSSLDGK